MRYNSIILRMPSTLDRAVSPAGRTLLTGATGLLGSRLLEILRPPGSEREVVVLVRRPEQAECFERRGIRAVVGDLSLPRLGLAESDYQDLESSLTEIVHTAADVRFDLPLAESRAVNVHGVRQLLDLAGYCRKLRKFAHVSTLFVSGYRQGAFPEEPTPRGQRFVNSYQQSKFEAEESVLDRMRHIPAAIYRLSVVIADSPQGHVSQFNYFHHLLRCLPGSPLPMAPGDPQAVVDLVTNDWAAAALAYLFEQRFTPGSIRHLCLGPQNSLRLEDAIERACRVIESHPNRSGRGPVRVPELVSLGEYNRFLAGCQDRTLRAVAEALGHHVRLLAIRQAHLNPLATADLAGSGISPGDPGQFLENTVRFCLDTDWGRKLPAVKAGAHA
jgi:nucleoside-diphosphate-sugar epimerase